MGLFQLLASMVFVFSVFAWVCVILFFPMFKSSAHQHPQQRLRSSRIWLYAPFWLPLVTITSSLVFSYLQNLLEQADHCFQTLSQHIHHLCGVHPPPTFDSILAWTLPFFLFSLCLGILFSLALRASRARSLIRNLIWHSNPCKLGADTWEVEQASFMAFTLGFWRSHIFFSKEFLSKIDIETLRIIHAHEDAHRNNRDCFWNSLDHSFALVYPKKIRQLLLNDLDLAREQRCDLWAARRVGCRIKVAKAITQAAQFQVLQPEGSLAIATQNIPERIRFLLRQDIPHQTLPFLPTFFIGSAFALGMGPIHHFAELVVNALLH